MASKRYLKHTIHRICTDLFAECIAVSLYGHHNHEENTKAILSSVLMIHQDFIRRVSHPEPGMEPKIYFDKLLEDFYKQANEILDQIRNLD